MELRPLQIPAFRVGDLIRGRASLYFSRDEVSERHASIGQRVAVLAPALAAVAELALLRARLIADVLGIGGELGMTHRRRRIAEAQVDVDALQALRVRL